MNLTKETGDDVEYNEDDEKLFMAQISYVKEQQHHLWFVDSGCLNHMTSYKSIFSNFNETQKQNVQLGNVKVLQVKGKGMIRLKINLGKYKFLHNV